MKRYSLTETPRPEMIIPYTQNPYLTFGTMQFIVRSNVETSALLTQVQRAIAAVDPTIPIAHVRTIEDLVATSASNARFATRFMLRPSARRTRTDSAGRFTVTGVSPASYTVVARKVGFIPETWDVKMSTATRVDITIVLGRHIPVLDTMVTRANRNCPLFSYEAFLCRQGSVGGVFLDDAAITDKDVIYVGQLFEDMMPISAVCTVTTSFANTFTSTSCPASGEAKRSSTILSAPT